MLGKYNSVITYNNVYRKKYSTVVIGLCSNSRPFLFDLLSHEVTLGILLNVFKPQFLLSVKQGNQYVFVMTNVVVWV